MEAQTTVPQETTTVPQKVTTTTVPVKTTTTIPSTMTTTVDGSKVDEKPELTNATIEEHVDVKPQIFSGETNGFSDAVNGTASTFSVEEEKEYRDKYLQLEVLRQLPTLGNMQLTSDERVELAGVAVKIVKHLTSDL